MVVIQINSHIATWHAAIAVFFSLPQPLLSPTDNKYFFQLEDILGKLTVP